MAFTRHPQFHRLMVLCAVAIGCWPTATLSSAASKTFRIEERKREHWCWQPIARPSIPGVRDAEWPANEIDRFILNRLEEQQIAPAAAADKRVLIRRATFALIGLPPTPEEITHFLSDPSPQAFATVVDRLLASSQFGESWARHWLDRVRYAETLGHEFDYAIIGAWRYRDYIIRALNQDLPFDQFLMEHVAGDLLPNPRSIEPGINESATATAFYFLGQQSHSPVDVKQSESDQMENEIDVLTKSFQGLTVACARCHDHKFDAISTADYYALYGVLSSSRYVQRVLNAAEIEPRARVLAALKADLRRLAAGAFEKAVMASTNEVLITAAAEICDTQANPVTQFGNFQNWLARGPAWEWKEGDFLLGSSNSLPVRSIIPPNAYHSARISRALQGEFQSPTFTITNRYLLIRAWGHESRLRVVVDNFTLIRSPIYGGLKRILDSDEPRWLVFDLETWKGHRAYVDVVDTTACDPADEQRNESGYAADGFAAIDRILVSESATPPVPGVQRSIFRREVIAALKSWSAGTLTPEQGWILNQVLPSLQTETSPALTEAWERCRAAERMLPAAVLIASAADGNGLDENLFRRGSHRNAEGAVTRHYLTALSGGRPIGSASNSGRLELARQMVDPANPMTARVQANYLWHHLMGRGLVATVDNFGVLGESPSHPELLDYLAGRLIEKGWSNKKLLREILLSRTYQMSSQSKDPLSDQRDVGNRLWHRAEVRRLEGEAIRDSMLFVSGQLRTHLYGPPVPIHLTQFMEGRGRPGKSGPLDGDGRRSLYLEVRRNFLSPMMLAFDFPIPATTVGRRSKSNVPAQGLTLMNDPFVQGQAASWAKRCLSTAASSDTQRIDELYERAFARLPNAEERDSALHFLSDPADVSREEAFAELCHVLFNVKEFVFVY